MLRRRPAQPTEDLAGFRLQREIGRGPRSVVYSADGGVAFKLLDVSGDLTGLRWPEHPSVPRLLDTGTSERGPYVAMDLIEGGTLETVRLSSRKLRRALVDVADALDAAHAQGLYHGNLASRNVLVDRHGRAHLSDFGLQNRVSPAEDLAAFAMLVWTCCAVAVPQPLPQTAREIAELIPRRGSRR